MFWIALASAVELQSSDYVVVRLDEPGVLEGEPLPGDGLTIRVYSEDAEERARELMHTPGVAWAHVDWLVDLQPAMDDPLYADQWHLLNTGQSGRHPGVDINAEAA